MTKLDISRSDRLIKAFEKGKMTETDDYLDYDGCLRVDKTAKVVTDTPAPTATPTPAPEATETPVPTDIPQPTATAAPTQIEMSQPTATPAPAVTSGPDVSAAPTAAAGEAGSVLKAGKMSYRVVGKNKVAFSKVDKKAAEVTIPKSVKIDGKKYTVTSIAKNAFNGSKVKSVTIPSTVKTIESKAFYKCKKLAKITFKGKTTVKTNAFADIKKGASFKVPKAFLKFYKTSLPKCGAKKYKLK